MPNLSELELLAAPCGLTLDAKGECFAIEVLLLLLLFDKFNTGEDECAEESAEVCFSRRRREMVAVPFAVMIGDERECSNAV